MSKNKKADLIKATYELLADDSPQEVSIRAIASAAGCTTGTVYRHFDSVDDLLLVACVKFLEDHMVNLNDILRQDDDPLYQHKEMWRSFGRQAFANVDAFELMFWKAAPDELNDAIFVYYQEFPDSWRKLSGFQAMVFFNSSIEERNLLTLSRCMAGYRLDHPTVIMISDMEVCCFHGLMMEYRDCYREPGKAEEGLARFMTMLDYFHGLIQSAAR